ncbi:MAG: phosphoadenosine phosphosulfate reductase family protein [Nocardioidaceae bacterium]
MTVTSVDELRQTALSAGPALELASAEAVIEWAVDTFGSRFCITSSMSDGVLAHLASRVAPGIDVVFVDTGYHFAETIGTRDAVRGHLAGQRRHLGAYHLSPQARRDIWFRSVVTRSRPLLPTAQSDAAYRGIERV